MTALQGAGAEVAPRRRRAERRRDTAAARLLPRTPDAIFVVLLLVVGAAPLWPVYDSSAFVVVAAASIVLGGALAVVGAARRLPAYAVAAVAAVLFLVGGVPLAVPSQAIAGVLPSAEGLRILLAGSATAWKQMLSVELPLGSYEALLVPAFIVLLASAVTGLSLALRLARPGWAVLAPVVLLAFSVAFGSRAGQVPVVTGLVFTGLALAWAIVAANRRRPGRESRGRWGRATAAVGLLVATTLAGGALAGVWTPATSRQVLRDAVAPPFDPHHYVSPLVTFRNSVLTPGKTTDQLTVTGLPSGARLSVATLDAYDGRVFAQGSSPSSGTFSRVASTISQSGATGSAADVTVRVDGYSDVWLPTVGAVTAISFSGTDAPALRDAFYYDRSTDSGAVLGGVSKGDGYSMSTIVPARTTASDVAAAKPGHAEQPKATNVPSTLIAAARKHYGTATSPGARLEAVASWLRSGYVSDSGPGQPFSAAGHSASRLAALATATPMLGDAEQYAPALALIARNLGFPSRVVVGYAPAASRTRSGSVTLTGADLTAWVEVEDSAGRWLTVDPNPTPRPVPDESTKQSKAVAQPQTVQPPSPPTQHDTAVTQNRDSQTNKHDPGPPAWLVVLLAGLRIAGLVLLVALIVLAPLWSIALGRWIRRRRRLRRDLDATVLTGAWSELLDDVVDRGYAVPRAATRREVADLVGAPALRTLADTAERSVFSSQRLDDAEVRAYWDAVGRARHGLADDESRWRRLRYHLTAGSLVRRLGVIAASARHAVTDRRTAVDRRRKDAS
ncbi:DUF3488 and transglutaminase-like domain-containing protein [Frondihabitans australicus]|uniref:Transglutaminase superfamily protein n=1 Tax=Frondihabitans australicus TaxID=386892 RepID=A0A495IDM1_9MICO|nr:transglutaminase domain-containing protein [Frondihabitans australicus]RKR73949.1 transglutaminase superfamily protein [Frondihabitans australicus]